MAVIGPGAIQQQTVAPTPALDDVSEYEFVTILNPLTDDFAIQVAQDIPVNMPMELRDKTAGVQDRNGLLMQYGQDFKNPDFQSRKHVLNQTIIKSGQTINLRGNEAQVAVRQLVNEMLQREGKTKLLADPYLRKGAEEKIIVGRGYIQDIMEGNLQTPQQQALDAIDKSNEVSHESTEQAFPGLQTVGQTDSSPATATENVTGSNGSSPKRMGRPPKTNS